MTLVVCTEVADFGNFASPRANVPGVLFLVGIFSGKDSDEALFATNLIWRRFPATFSENRRSLTAVHLLKHIAYSLGFGQRDANLARLAMLPGIAAVIANRDCLPAVLLE